MPEKRVILRADITPQAKAGIEQVCHKRGMTQLSVMSRLIVWFSRQEARVQRAVLGQSKENARDLLICSLQKKITDAANRK